MFTYILTGFSKIIRVNLLNKYEDSKKVHLKFVQSAQNRCTFAMSYRFLAHSGSFSKIFSSPFQGNRIQQEKSIGASRESRAPYL